MTKIFVLVDLQNDFIQPNGLLTINAPELPGKVQKFIQETNGFFDQYVVTYDTHMRGVYPLTFEGKQFPLHCEYGTDGWKVPVEMPTNKPVLRLMKNTTNLFNDAHQYPFLNQNFRFDQIYIAGVCADICVEQAIDGFLKRRADVTIFLDLTKGLIKQMPQVLDQQKYGIKRMDRLRAMTTQEFQKQIGD